MAHSQSSTCSSSVASTQESAPIGGNLGGLSTQSVPVDCESKQGKDGKTFRSPMWKHFTHLVVNNEEKAQCNYCKKLFVGKSSYGTSHLQQHFDRCPRRKAAGGDIRQMILKTDLKGNVNSGAFNEKQGIEKLAKMIILHDYPLLMVEHRGFRDFTTTIQPLFKCPCDAPKPGGPLTTRQLAENKWMSGYPTPLQKIGQSLLCTGSSTQLQNLHIPVPNNPIYAK